MIEPHSPNRRLAAGLVELVSMPSPLIPLSTFISVGSLGAVPLQAFSDNHATPTSYTNGRNLHTQMVPSMATDR